MHPTYNIEVMDVTGNAIDYTVHMCTIQAKIDADKESKESAPPAHASVGAGGHMPGVPFPGLSFQGYERESGTRYRRFMPPVAAASAPQNTIRLHTAQ